MAPEALALADDVSAASSASYFEPFWRYLTLVAVGVVPLMNVTQSLAMVAAVPVNVDDGDALALDEAAAVVAAELAAGDDDVAVAAAALLELLLEPLEQAVVAAASARPSAGTSSHRRAIILVRILSDASLDGRK